MPRRRRRNAAAANEDADQTIEETEEMQVTEDIRPTRVILKPEMKKREQSMGEYIQYFKRVIRANDWNDRQAGMIFPAMIPQGDPALQVINGLLEAAFSEIEEKLNNSQMPFREAHLGKLMNARLDEDIMEFKQSVCNLVADTYSSFDAKQKEQLSRDFFLYGLSNQLREKVLLVKAATLDEVILRN
jgi:hypothetical protein